MASLYGYDMGCVGWKTNMMRSQLKAQKGRDLLCQGYKMPPRARLIIERTEGDWVISFDEGGREKRKEISKFTWINHLYATLETNSYPSLLSSSLVPCRRNQLF